uniref:Uncharacterized protein n=1 Tax=Anguilla anguilla TaxID=7936 RepID=A0A0E9XKR6_ANGAN
MPHYTMQLQTKGRWHILFICSHSWANQDMRKSMHDLHAYPFHRVHTLREVLHRGSEGIYV